MDSITFWYKERVGHSLSHNTGHGAIIYFVDSGIDTTHPEFINANITNLHSFDGTFEDTFGHGTGLASILVGKTLGIVPDATVKNVKINVEHGITIDQVVDAFDAILADKVAPVSVVNCSWTILNDERLSAKTLELQGAGFIIVGAAGNEIRCADIYFPIGFPNVLGVGASDPDNHMSSWESSRGSNWGTMVDLIAPGIEIEVATRDGSTAPAAGTSLGTALTSGVIAQYITKYPDKTAGEIQEMVLRNALPNVVTKDEGVYGSTANLFIQTYTEDKL